MDYLVGLEGRGHFGLCDKWEAVPIRFPSSVYKYELKWNDDLACTCGAEDSATSGRQERVAVEEKS